MHYWPFQIPGPKRQPERTFGAPKFQHWPQICANCRGAEESARPVRRRQRFSVRGTGVDISRVWCNPEGLLAGGPRPTEGPPISSPCLSTIGGYLSPECAICLTRRSPYATNKFHW